MQKMRIHYLACLLLAAGVTNSIWRRLANTFNKRQMEEDKADRS